MTKREYFDLLVKTSLEGGFPSTSYMGCAYRGVEGRKCAYGLLIPDDEYRPEMEGCGLTQIYKKQWHPEGMSLADLRVVQSCHDWMAFDVVSGRSTHSWDHQKFVQVLLEISCFREYKASLTETFSVE